MINMKLRVDSLTRRHRASARLTADVNPGERAVAFKSALRTPHIHAFRRLELWWMTKWKRSVW